MQTKNVFFILSILTFLLFSCSRKSVVGPEPGSFLIAFTYELPVSDTAMILQTVDGAYSFLQPDDSSLSSVDTIFYDLPGPEIHDIPYLKKANLVKTSSLNPWNKEYYVQNKNGFYFLGYSTADTIRPYEIFDKPLIILPRNDVRLDSSSARRNIWLADSKEFQPETKTETRIALVRTGYLLQADQEIECSIYNLRLSGDVKMPYGEQELIIPEAIVMESTTCYNAEQQLLFEWSILSRPLHDKRDTGEPDLEPEFITYLKYTIYLTDINN